jgi:hypothetical protein
MTIAKLTGNPNKFIQHCAAFSAVLTTAGLSPYYLSRQWALAGFCLWHDLAARECPLEMVQYQ